MSMILLSSPLPNVAQITLNRPEKRNALNGEMIKEWLYVLQNLAEDNEVQTVLLTANGEHFCAGADIAWMQQVAKLSHEENLADALQLASLLKMIYQFPKPMIALIQGATMGGGLGVIAACDIVIAAEHASFCFSETKIGLAPSVISPYVIPLIGERAARYYYLTADKFTAEKAMKLGLVQRVINRNVLLETGLQVAKELASKSPVALVEAKKIIQHVVHAEYSDLLVQFTAEHLAGLRSTEEAQKRLKTFLQHV